MTRVANYRDERSGQRGAALLLALWLLLLMSGLIAVFALSARTEGLQASALRQATAARFAAESGIEVAMLHLLTPDPLQRWVADGRPYRFALEGYEVEVAVQDETGKFDLNVVSIAHFSQLLQVLGVELERAEAIAAAVVDWRDGDDLLSLNGAEAPQYAAAELPYAPRNQPFLGVAELQLVLGMDHALYRQVAPFLTVYSGEVQPRPPVAAPEVLQALGLAPEVVAELLALRGAWQPGMPPPVLPDGLALAAEGSGTYSISSRARRTGGTALEVTAVLRAGSGGPFGQLYAPLAWRVGDPD